LEKGAFFPDCRHSASTFPASSLATLATGAWPSQHGIVAGSWYDRATQKPVTASDEALLATTLAAQLAADPQNRVYAVSMDSWQASLFAGTSSARRFWMDDTGQVHTLGEPPDWLAAYNSQKQSLDTLRDAKWQAVGAPNDAPALRILSFSPERPREFLALYRSSRFALGAQFDLVAELINNERLGQVNSFDFLCILVDATAMLGYEMGAYSPLMQQLVLNVDRRLEALVSQLSKAVGENAFNLVFAGAHGAPPIPPTEFRNRMMVNGEQVAQAIQKGLAPSASGRVEKYIYPFVYLDTGGFRDPEQIRMLAARAALQHPAVSGFYTAGGACSTRDDFQKRFSNSFHPTRSGDVMLSYRSEYVEEYGQGRGISYGSLYNYDVRVPLCFYGPQFRAGVFESPVESVDVAPTLARVMGVATPSSSEGLGEALAP
jgi:predicted AlkP superfamily pyrophosphatase or phosphodiesterase